MKLIESFKKIFSLEQQEDNPYESPKIKDVSKKTLRILEKYNSTVYQYYNLQKKVLKRNDLSPTHFTLENYFRLFSKLNDFVHQPAKYPPNSFEFRLLRSNLKAEYTGMGPFKINMYKDRKDEIAMLKQQSDITPKEVERLDITPKEVELLTFLNEKIARVAKELYDALGF